MTETRYTPELAEAILQRVSEGSSLSEACREEGIPESTARQWARDNRSGFGLAYQQARALQLEAWSDRIVDTAHRTDIEAADKRVICDSYKWILSKLRPERYGERLLVAGDAENPIQHLHRAVAPALADLPDDALDALQVFCSRMLLKHEPPGAIIEDDAVPALLGGRQ